MLKQYKASGSLLSSYLVWYCIFVVILWWLKCPKQEEGVEAGVATQQMLQGVVLALGVLVEEVAMMEVTGTTTDQKEMVFTGLVHAKIEGSQVTKYQEMDKIKQSR